jgi:transcriptional regulator with XRE-family HTH domain
MRVEDRAVVRRQLDKEQRFFQMAEKHHNYGPRWLRRVRQALGVRAEDMARELNVNRSVIFRREESEARQTISLKALEKLAGAMGCTLVYAIVPRGGKTLVELAETQLWMKKLEKAEIESRRDLSIDCPIDLERRN